MASNKDKLGGWPPKATPKYTKKSNQRDDHKGAPTAGHLQPTWSDIRTDTPGKKGKKR